MRAVHETGGTPPFRFGSEPGEKAWGNALWGGRVHQRVGLRRQRVEKRERPPRAPKFCGHGARKHQEGPGGGMEIKKI